MSYNAEIAERVKKALESREGLVERKMFGGIAFMHRGNMCCGIVDEMLMARVGPDAYEEALKRPHAREMDFTGKSLKGFVYVEPAGFAEDEQIQKWISLCEAFTGSLPPK